MHVERSLTAPLEPVESPAIIMHDLSHHTRASRCKSGIGLLMESLWANAKGRTILSTTIRRHLDLFIYIY